VDPERLVFVDEFGAKTDLTRIRGWAESGERLVEAVPGRTWETATVVHAVNGLCFTGFCEQFLVPTLQSGDIVVLDNLASHKTAAAIAAIERVGAKVAPLPPYSPDLNPIENIFSKIKQLIRGFRPRTWPEIIEAIKRALLQITCSDLYHAFLHCGYADT